HFGQARFHLWFMVRAPCLQKGPVPGLAARAFRDDCHCCPVRPIEKPRSNKPRMTWESLVYVSVDTSGSNPEGVAIAVAVVILAFGAVIVAVMWVGLLR